MHKPPYYGSSRDRISSAVSGKPDEGCFSLPELPIVEVKEYLSVLKHGMSLAVTYTQPFRRQ